MSEFCKFLSHGYSFTKHKGELIIKPCCWFTDNEKFDNHTFVRQKWEKINDWVPGCKVCKQQEEAGFRSFRKASFDIIPAHLPPSPVAIDINLDYDCNAACVICGPGSSSAWQQQLKKQNILKIVQKETPTDINFILTTLDFSNVRRVKFFGGEPMLTRTHIDVLKNIKNCKETEIWYTTNGSILPDKELIDLWSKFKLVYFEVSIDGIDKKFEYIRWPLSWNKITNNLFELKNIAPNNLLFRINHTLNPFNSFYYDELVNWVQTQFNANRLGDPVEINVHPCWGVWNLNKTPMALRKVIFEKYKNTQPKIVNLLQLLPYESCREIKKFTEYWDPIRDLYWQSIFPEIVDYFP